MLQPLALNKLQVLFHQATHFLQRSQWLVHLLLNRPFLARFCTPVRLYMRNILAMNLVAQPFILVTMITELLRVTMPNCTQRLSVFGTCRVV